MVLKSTPINVLFISHDSGNAGAQRCLCTLLEEIDRKTVSPHLIVPYEGEMSRHAIDIDIPVYVRHLVHWIPCTTFANVISRYKYLYRLIKTLRARCWAIASIIEKHKIDLVYTNTVTCVEGALAARMTNKPHIWHIHEPITGNRELTPLLPEKLYSKIVDLYSNAVIFPSNILTKLYRLPYNKIYVSHNGIKPIDIIEKKTARKLVSAKLDINPSKKWIAVIGAIHPRKDHYTFIEAAEKIHSQNQNTVFLIIGLGNKEHMKNIKQKIIKSRICNSIKLCGNWPESIHLVMAAIDVLVISSEQESFGLTAIEALLQGTPVVSTRCGGPEEIIEDGKHGFLTNIKDACGMAKAVVRILNEEEMAKKMGKTGRVHVLQNFSHKRYVNDISNIILETWKRAMKHTE